jgi:hypothetical protein
LKLRENVEKHICQPHTYHLIGEFYLFINALYEEVDKEKSFAGKYIFQLHHLWESGKGYYWAGDDKKLAGNFFLKGQPD